MIITKELTAGGTEKKSVWVCNSKNEHNTQIQKNMVSRVHAKISRKHMTQHHSSNTSEHKKEKISKS
jgi:predicted RNA-binding protein YlxR (DUF448 family)